VIHLWYDGCPLYATKNDGNNHLASMGNNCLDIRMVLDIQRALRNGRPVTEAVARLTRASLPGIMEYGCLRWCNPQVVPPLPPAIVSSPLGVALQEVVSPFGLRQRGAVKAPIRDSRRRDFEFMVVVEPADVVDNLLFGEYLLRFEFGAKEIGLPRVTATRLQAALHEMASNAVTHAKAPVPALIGYEVRGNGAAFCVVDVGIGVLASLRSNPAYERLSIYSEAIRLALQEGVSSVTGDFGRGYGFRSVFKSLAEQYGILHFRSGEGSIEMHGMDLDADKGEERRSLPYLEGFQVAVSCRTGPPASAKPSGI
jgi:hypothetical protein